MAISTFKLCCLFGLLFFLAVNSHGVSHSPPHHRLSERDEMLPDRDKRGTQIFYPHSPGCNNCSSKQSCCKSYFGRRVLYEYTAEGGWKRRGSGVLPAVSVRLAETQTSCGSDFNFTDVGFYMWRDASYIVTYASAACRGSIVPTYGFNGYPVCIRGVRTTFYILNQNGPCSSIEKEPASKICRGNWHDWTDPVCWGWRQVALSVIVAVVLLGYLADAIFKIRRAFCCCGLCLPGIVFRFWTNRRGGRSRSGKKSDDSDSDDNTGVRGSSGTVKMSVFSQAILMSVLMIVAVDAACQRPFTVQGSVSSCVQTLDVVKCSTEFATEVTLLSPGSEACMTVTYEHGSEMLTMTLEDVIDEYDLSKQYETGHWHPYVETTSRCAGTSGCHYDSCAYGITWGTHDACVQEEISNSSSADCFSSCHSVGCPGDCFAAKCCLAVRAYVFADDQIEVYSPIFRRRVVWIDANGTRLSYQSGQVQVGDMVVQITSSGGTVADPPRNTPMICHDKRTNIWSYCQATAAGNPQKSWIGDVQMQGGKIMKKASGLITYSIKGSGIRWEAETPAWETAIKRQLPYEDVSSIWTVDGSKLTAHRKSLDSSVKFFVVSTEEHQLTFYRSASFPKMKGCKGSGYKNSDTGCMVCCEFKSDPTSSTAVASIDDIQEMVSLPSEYTQFCLSSNCTLKHHHMRLRNDFGTATAEIDFEYEEEPLFNETNRTTGKTFWKKVSTSAAGISVMTILCAIIVIIVALIAFKLSAGCFGKMKVP